MASHEHNGPGDDSPLAATEAESINDHTNEAVTIAATVGVVAVGAALIEVALLPGIALGVAAMLAARFVPKVGEALTPIVRSSVRGLQAGAEDARDDRRGQRKSSGHRRRS